MKVLAIIASNIKRLYVNDSAGITDVNNLKYLEVLYMIGECWIDDAGINKLRNIKELYAKDNKGITNVNNLKYLKQLDASGNCGIDYTAIKQLKYLTRLNAENNEKINKKSKYGFMQDFFKTLFN